jgi:hypothetical protein
MGWMAEKLKQRFENVLIVMRWLVGEVHMAAFTAPLEKISARFALSYQEIPGGQGNQYLSLLFQGV